MPSLAAIALQGALLGWSVAWPPGPVNLEILRRGSRHGFWRGWWVGAGALCGDFTWALLMSFGMGFVARNATLKLILGVVSTAFLFLIVVSLMKNWAKRMNTTVALETAPPAASTRNGFLLGLGLSVTSPWNATFWLAIAGQGMSLGTGWAPSLLLAVSVMAGAGLWVVLLSLSASAARGVIGLKWQRFAEPAAALLMLFFALQSIIRLASI